MKKLRQKDIASEAGVSPSTVSLLLKDPKTTRVSDETRERIFAIIRKHRPVRGGPGPVGDIICAMPAMPTLPAEICDFFYASLFLMAQKTGQQYGYSLRLMTYTDYAVLAPLAKDPSVAGILSVNSSRLAEELPSRKPVVAVNAVYTSACDVVKSNHRGSARDQVALLTRHGHRRIAYFVTDPPPYLSAGVEEQHEGESERFSGYCEGLYQHELPIRPDYIYRESLPEHGLELEEPARRAFRQFWDLDEKPTAIIAFNDVHAFYLLRAAREAGVKVPRDVSISGNDNMQLGQHSNPPLTTSEQGRAELGRVAVERLIQRIEGRAQGPFQTISIPFTLVERKSTGPAPASPSARRKG